RGVGLETLGITRDEIARRIEHEASSQRTGTLFQTPVQPQRRRQEARQRLNERVRSAASEVLRVLKLSIAGYDLPRVFPDTASKNNIGAAIVLLNREIQSHLGTTSAERDLLGAE